ncbi:hypothetical protein [Hymenobacter glacialis]|uniref:Lipoprotein n=1 Tax=Hymenobacter glacialis TaxID=1908236 RepID=A0A1G1T6M5_9BACT|nr:hypothetical protein [Hymenobacter glacialis]OGX86509.1 hypothetical protein BEN48_12830 [Hymenobacter glacialis]
MKQMALSLLSLALTLSSCEKEGVDALPKATQKGLNKMGCLVDGKAWLPYRDPVQQGGNRPPMVAYWQRREQGRVSLTMLFMRNTRPKRFGSLVYLFVRDITGPSTLALDQPANPQLTSANPAYGAFINTDETPDLDYLTGPTATGHLTITRFDTTARVASGTFAFTGRADDNSGRTVQVSEGRFDVQLERR